MNRWYVYSIMLAILISCNSDEKIIKLLNSNNKEDVINGAQRAGDSKNKMFVSHLLKNANDFRTSTSIKHYGMTVYQAKMTALKKIFEKEPPVKITYKPDSTVIKFYTDLYEKMN